MARTYLLVHGAWHGGWCWNRVLPSLAREGHSVLAPDVQDATLEAGVERLCGIIDAQSAPVVLVGHSMAGALISQAAEYRPDRVELLVYLCAYLLLDGESLRDASRRDKGSKAPPVIVRSEDRSTMSIQKGAAGEVIYSGCSREDVAWAESRLIPQAVAPWATPLRVTPERFGRVPRVYIECLRDQAISLKLQREMQAAVPCREVYTLDTGHAPFLSAPEELAKLLANLP